MDRVADLACSSHQASGWPCHSVKAEASLAKGVTTTSAGGRAGVRESHPGHQRGPGELESVSDVGVDGED